MADNQYNYGGYGYNPLDPRAQFMSSEQPVNATTDPILTKPYGASDAGNVGSVSGAMPGYAGGFLGNQSASFLGGANGPNVAGNMNNPLQTNPVNEPMSAQDMSKYSFGSYTPPQAQSTLGQMGVDNNAALQRSLGDYQAGNLGMPGASGQADYEQRLAALRMQSEIATAADKAQKAASARPFDTMQSTGMYASDPLIDMQRRLETYGSLNQPQQYYLQNQMQGMNQGQIGQLTQSLQPQQSQQQYQSPQNQNNQNPYLQPFQQQNSYKQSIGQNWASPAQPKANDYWGSQGSSQNQGMQQYPNQQSSANNTQNQFQNSFQNSFQQPRQQRGSGLLGQQQPQNQYGLLGRYAR